MDFLFVANQVAADNLSSLDIDERLPEIFEMIYSLQDPSYDAKKEAAIREEMRQIEEREEQRLREGRAIHPSLEKDKRVIDKEELRPLPKQGGINFGLINQLNNKDKEG